MEGVVVETKLGHPTDIGRFNQEIGAVNKLQEEFAATRLFEVAGHASLASRVGRPVDRLIQMVGEERRDAATRGACRRFHLDDVCAEIGQHLSSQDATLVAEVEDSVWRKHEPQVSGRSDSRRLAALRGTAFTWRAGKRLRHLEELLGRSGRVVEAGVGVVDPLRDDAAEVSRRASNDVCRTFITT